jgi:hypothetical protein
MLAAMATECFCGCNAEVPFGRRRAANALGRQYDKDLALFEGAVERHADPEHETELSSLVARGRVLRDRLRDIVHGTADRKQFDKAASRAWLSEAGDHRLRLANAAGQDDYAGWNTLEQSELVNTGSRAPAVILDLEDTGMLVNHNPRVRLRLRVEPPGEPTFEVERKVVVSKVKIPRIGERVDVAYDPEDPERFTFRIADLTDDAAAAAAPSRVDQLAKLAELRASGALTDEEFEAEKRRLLANG